MCSVHINKEHRCRRNSLVLVGLERLQLHYLQQWKTHYSVSTDEKSENNSEIIYAKMKLATFQMRNRNCTNMIEGVIMGHSRNPLQYQTDTTGLHITQCVPLKQKCSLTEPQATIIRGQSQENAQTTHLVCVLGTNYVCKADFQSVYNRKCTLSTQPWTTALVKTTGAKLNSYENAIRMAHL